MATVIKMYNNVLQPMPIIMSVLYCVDDSRDVFTKLLMTHNIYQYKAYTENCACGIIIEDYDTEEFNCIGLTQRITATLYGAMSLLDKFKRTTPLHRDIFFEEFTRVRMHIGHTLPPTKYDRMYSETKRILLDIYRENFRNK